MRASGDRPSCSAFVSLITIDRGGAVVERAGVAGGDLAVGAEHRLQLGELLDGGAGAGAVVLGHDGAVGEGDRRDLAVEEPTLLGGDGPLLRAGAPLVHLLAGDALGQHHVLGGLAHRDVDVGEAGRRLPGVGAAGALGAAGLGVGEGRVVRTGVGGAVEVAAHRLHAAGHEHVALAGLDGVGGHADRLERRGAVAVDRDAGDVGQPGEQGRHAGDVVARPRRRAGRSPRSRPRRSAGRGSGPCRAPP